MTAATTGIQSDIAFQRYRLTFRLPAANLQAVEQRLARLESELRSMEVSR